MFKKLISKIVGDPQKKLINRFQPVLEDIDSYESILEELSDEELRSKTIEFSERLSQGETLDDLMPEAFAVVREASRRTTGLRHYDVQMIGGALLHQGEVVEMRTGEGKTLVGTCPLYLNALSGEGVHLVTVNEYLARRDGGWMGKIFHVLGLTVAVIGPQNYSALYDPDYVHPGSALEDERLVHWRPCTREDAYQADITYGIASEFGFDYLRDNLVSKPDNLVQKELNYAIIDEVDNILIDEARTPLIISGPSHTTGKDYERFAKYVSGLSKNTAEEDDPPTGDYDLDEKSRSVSLTELGIAKVEDRIPEIDVDAGDSLYDPRFFHFTYYVENALKAQYLFKRDKQYVVKNGEVIIVDDFTGRLMPGRRYSDGLHEAIEAKEGVQIKRENVTIATITLQNYFRMYKKLAGMTGTAETDAEEFKEIYDVDVTALPTNVQYIVDTGSMGLIERKRKRDNVNEIYYVLPNSEEPLFFQRTDFPDQVYGTEVAKDQAIIEEVKRVHETGQPILVGTTSVEHSETIHNLLDEEKIPHFVLNAKIHQSEALIVAQAGRRAAVTISTNMAGRGTDILLGGNPEGLAVELLENTLFQRKHINQLAETFLKEGRNSAEHFAQKHTKLTVDLVEALYQLQQEYDKAIKEINKSGLDLYLAKFVQESCQVNQGIAQNIIRLVRRNLHVQARQLLIEHEQDTAIIEEINRLANLYTNYGQSLSNLQENAQFLAGLVFETHYNGRAALIRAIMAGEKQKAKQLANTVPGLFIELIEQVNHLQLQAEEEKQKVWELGGLHVIGSERHESRRIDNQLRGRAARQGDPGSSRFFLSLEDDLMKRFGGERLKNFMARTNLPDDMPIESSVLDRLIESSQERIEGYNFDIRKNVVEYDDVMNLQRLLMYNQRRSILMGEVVDLDVRITESFESAINKLAENYLDNYPNFIESEINRTIQSFHTDATDTINVSSVLVRLKGLLPQVIHLDKDDLPSNSVEKLSQSLLNFAHQNEQEGTNIYQFLQAVGRFIPLVPPVPNLGGILSSRRSGHLQVRERIKHDFVKQVETLFNDFLAEYTTDISHNDIWQKTSKDIEEVFSQFNISRVNPQELKAQQTSFQSDLYNILRELLFAYTSALSSEQLVGALGQYVHKQQDQWRQRIGEEEYQNFQCLLLLSAIDREWRDYLTAVDDLRREIGLSSIGQKDPKVEFKRRSYIMFDDMQGNIDESVADRFFRDILGHQAFIRRQQEASKVALQLNHRSKTQSNTQKFKMKQNETSSKKRSRPSRVKRRG